jgi:hypothetical protein
MATSAGYAIDAPGLAVFEIGPGGDRVVVWPVTGSEGALEELLSESVLPLLDQLRGAPSLHASSVGIGDRAVGFIGRSHSGKSTMAAVMAARSARLLGDDCLRVESTPGGFVITPYSAGVRLRGAAADTFAGPDARQTWDGRTLVPLPAAGAPLRIAALYLLEQTDGAPFLEPVLRRDAMATLASHLHRLDPTEPELLKSEFAFLEKLVDTVRIARLGFRRTFSDADRAAALVEADLEQLA